MAGKNKASHATGYFINKSIQKEMKTKFTRVRKLALQNESNRVVAIINCVEGDIGNDITLKLEQAIKEDRGASQVNIVTNRDIDDWDIETFFTVHVYEPEGETDGDYYEDYQLTFAEEY